jgi:hypothetical protein
MAFFVICPACNEEHFLDEVEFLNVEEGPQREDIMTFQCYKSNTTQRSVVYGSPHSFNF